MQFYNCVAVADEFGLIVLHEYLSNGVLKEYLFSSLNIKIAKKITHVTSNLCRENYVSKNI